MTREERHCGPPIAPSPPPTEAVSPTVAEASIREVCVKICGVTTPEDASLAVRLGATDIGINFYRPSPRSIDLERARQIRRAVPSSCRLVGVFVNHPRAEVEELSEAAGLDRLQFHGDEQTAEIVDLAGRSIRALRANRDLDPARLAELRPFWALLVDAPHDQLYGGTGESWDYRRARGLLASDEPSNAGPVRLYVAGGVSPENVGALLHGLPGIFGIDVCSSVEASPGRKDPQRMELLFSEVKRFLEELEEKDGGDES